MRITVCQLSDGGPALEESWAALVAHARAERSELVVLPEVPFGEWPMWTSPADPTVWAAFCAEHDRFVGRLGELGGAAVAGSRPVTLADGGRRNEAFVWSAADGYRAAHHKYYLPDEDGFWEATWYERGDGSFDPIPAATATAGFLLCTELWFGERARTYGRDGANLIVASRATPMSSRDKWIVAGRTAAIVAGAFCASSNRAGTSRAGFEWAGTGMVIDPEGAVLALTDTSRPFATVDIDLSAAAFARKTFPRYVAE